MDPAVLQEFHQGHWHLPAQLPLAAALVLALLALPAARLPVLVGKRWLTAILLSIASMAALTGAEILADDLQEKTLMRALGEIAALAVGPLCLLFAWAEAKSRDKMHAALGCLIWLVPGLIAASILHSGTQPLAWTLEPGGYLPSQMLEIQRGPVLWAKELYLCLSGVGSMLMIGWRFHGDKGFGTAVGGLDRTSPLQQPAGQKFDQIRLVVYEQDTDGTFSH